MIAAVGLPALSERIDEEAHWNRMLSPGEQQRLGIARALLYAPDYLFLDEATASLDEPSEAALYHMLDQKLSRATIVSIGHRSTLAAFHRRRLALNREGDHVRVARNSSHAGRLRKPLGTKKERAATGRGRRPGTDFSSSLLQAAKREIGRQFGDEAGTAPIGSSGLRAITRVEDGDVGRADRLHSDRW